ncbi:MAG: hypothetical protein JWM38_2080 [Sphingomonas bacterium]|nr:hypothetical protein [Sphingomonas bacterium]
MQLTRSLLDPALIQLAGMSLVSALLIAWTVPAAYRRRRVAIGGQAQLVLAILSSAVLAMLVTGQPIPTLIAAGIGASATIALRLALPRLTLPGAIGLTAPSLMMLVGGPWSYLLLQEAGYPDWALRLVAISAGVSVLMVGYVFAGRLAQQALLTHRHYARATTPLAPYQAARLPKVSIQLPCYAEPPHVVIAAIDRLARLDYPNFEVMVCDNNTKDEALWRPLEAHCRRLNAKLGFDRFRFFHVSPLPGVKAGALNFCLTQMAPDAELIAVIDADYYSRPDFLSRLVGFFDDAAVGYIQTPHDYRDHESTYLRNCYWEYMPSNKIDMAGVQEYGAAFTIGTMCILRTKALREAGGWAEWCLTEDSEVSIRLRALGYEGVYLRETFGRGLIPATFGDYKKQRFRWTAGPVQQLRRYWRLFLPAPFGPRSLGGWSKLLEFQRSVVPLTRLVGAATAIVGGGATAVLTAHGVLPTITLPDAAWATVALGVATAPVTLWQRYRLTGCTRIRDMIGGEIARMSLTWVAMLGGIAGLSRKPIAWQRTPKFAVAGSLSRAFSASAPETAIGFAHLGAIGGVLAAGDAIGADFSTLAVAGLLMSSLRFFAATAMAVLSERDLAIAERAGKDADMPRRAPVKAEA